MTSEYLEWDSQFFSKEIAKISFGKEDSTQILNQALIDFKSESFDMIYLFADDELLLDDEILKRFNGKLVDQKITFHCTLDEIEMLSEELVELGEDNFSESCKKLAYVSGEYSRFKRHGFQQQDFERLYDKWLEVSLNRQFADQVFGTIDKDEVSSFVSVRVKDDSGRIGLIAVDPKMQGRGIGSLLIKKTKNYLISRQIEKLYVPTQKDNITACKFYKRLGFRVHKLESIYHFILNEDSIQ